jgi:hypothetical protein
LDVFQTIECHGFRQFSSIGISVRLSENTKEESNVQIFLGCRGPELEESMRVVPHQPQAQADAGLLWNSYDRTCKGIVLICALALALAGPLCASPRSCPAAAKLSSTQNPQAVAPQDANAQQQPVLAAPGQELSKPSQITYNDGQLTIITENAPLSEVLSAVRAAMGADIDLPAGAATQRIWVRLGPGPARKILRDLLDSTEFNYVIQASESDSEGVRSVMLTLGSKSPETAGQGNMVARGSNRKGSPSSSNPLDAAEQDEPPSSPLVNTAEAATPDSQPPPVAPASQASKIPSLPVSSEIGSTGPLGRNPDQMIQQLQSMYEQRRQIQMQRNQKQPTAN